MGTTRDDVTYIVWLRKDQGASWEKLADAVERCGYNKLYRLLKISERK